MLADLCFTYVFQFFFYLLSFFRRLISELAERNSTTIGHVVRSQCNLKTHVRNLGYPLPLQIGGPKTTFFEWLPNLMATLTAYIFGTERYRQSVKCVDNYEGSPTSSQNVMNFGPQTASNLICILPTLRKFCIPLHCRLRRWRSANGTRSNFAKRWTVGRANKVP